MRNTFLWGLLLVGKILYGQGGYKVIDTLFKGKEDTAVTYYYDTIFNNKVYNLGYESDSQTVAFFKHKCSELSATEHGFAITKDANGYHVTAIAAGTEANLNVDASSLPGDMVAIMHIHPQDATGGKSVQSSTDIYWLNQFVTSPELAGNIVINGNDMYLLTINDAAKYASFVTIKDKYYDKSQVNGWKTDSKIDDDFKSFRAQYLKYLELNGGSGNDITLVTQMYLMEQFNMGVSLQQWDAGNNIFTPKKLNLQLNSNSSAGTSISNGGNTIRLKYELIEIANDCN